jgi:hypothetical protein
LRINQLLLKVIRITRHAFLALLKYVNPKIPIEDDLLEFVSTACFIGFKDSEWDRIQVKLDESRMSAQIINDAKLILAGNLNAAGEIPFEFGAKINWHIDVWSKFVWPKRYYKFIRLSSTTNKADIKVPWELSRFQHIHCLGIAWRLTKDEIYAQKIVDHIQDWIQCNPPQIGVNWTCTMEVAIRAVNWIFATQWLADYHGFHRIRQQFNSVLFHHGKHIERNLENIPGQVNNHFLSNLAGLFFLGLYFSKGNARTNTAKPALRWVDYSIKELEKYGSQHVFADGMTVESSTMYHRLIAEIYINILFAARNNDLSLPKCVIEKAKSIVDVLGSVSESNSAMPQVGDADDGRLVVFENYYDWCKQGAGFVIDLAQSYFQDVKFNAVSSKPRLTRLLLSGDLVLSGQESGVVPETCNSGKAPRGFHLIQDQASWCLIRCGQLAKVNSGGHAHNDQLSFVLYINGKPIFSDPGSGAYTSDVDLRQRMRSTSMHSTLSVEGQEQNLLDAGLFIMADRCQAICDYADRTEFQGSHSGFDPQFGITHSRKLKLISGGMRIEDIFQSKKEIPLDCLKLNFILDPQVHVEKSESGIVLRNGPINVKICSTEGSLLIDQVPFAFHYGKIVQTNRLRASMNKNLNSIVEITRANYV